MRGLTAYSRVHATVRALYSMLLSLDNWKTLLQAQDFDSVLRTLSKTVYEPYLQIDRAALTPRRTIYQITRHLAEVYEKIINLTPEPGCRLLTQLWHLYEVDNVKAALRGVETGASWNQVRYVLHPISTKHATLTEEDMENILNSKDMKAAIEQMQHTPYYDTLIHALERYEAEQNLFPLEVALDLDYRRRLWQTIQHLKGLDHEQALHTVGTMLDVDNLLWAMRYRIYHHLSVEEIINYTLPFGYQVNDSHIRAIASGTDITKVVKRIYPDLNLRGFEKSTPAWEEDNDNSSQDQSQGLPKLELALQRHLIKLFRKTFLGYPFHIGIPVAYLQLNEHEITDLTVVIEAKASHLPLKTFTPMLEIYQPGA